MLIFTKYDVFLSLRIVFTLTNSVDPDEMPHCVAFHLDLHCLSKYRFRGLKYTKGYRMLFLLMQPIPKSY